ncbi:hypothetical protein Hypma_000512 [Hypsizygus marmoreus]|uniref:Uncharacterized protein n=1 Tax=Hypsizygus marmoreus TaxID=39966 RepID=A0A369JCJ4_HYPMA|nr:hypothetical protein Hypma_000512 [Hypsizygus marmoreus]
MNPAAVSESASSRLPIHEALEEVLKKAACWVTEELLSVDRLKYIECTKLVHARKMKVNVSAELERERGKAALERGDPSGHRSRRCFGKHALSGQTSRPDHQHANNKLRDEENEDVAFSRTDSSCQSPTLFSTLVLPRALLTTSALR